MRNNMNHHSNNRLVQNMSHHPNHDTVVVYRSRGEQMTDQFLWEEGGIVYIFGLMLATAAIAIAYEKIRTT